MKFDKKQLLLYAVTPTGVKLQTLLDQITLAIQGGVTMIQLREKGLSDEEYLAKAIAIQRLCKHFRVPLIINDRVDIAQACGAAGVHLGADDLPVAQVRSRVPKDFIIGATAKTVAQAKAAQRDGANYLGVGAVFPSPTKQNVIRITTEQLREICSSVTIPAVAIGGISGSNLDTLSDSGICGVAVVSSIFGAGDIRTASASLLAMVTDILQSRKE
jgi:thiamine-phosphate pyrophosphorylase